MKKKKKRRRILKYEETEASKENCLHYFLGDPREQNKKKMNFFWSFQDRTKKLKPEIPTLLKEAIYVTQTL